MTKEQYDEIKRKEAERLKAIKERQIITKNENTGIHN